MSLQGALSDFPVADVFQLIGHQRKTGVLEIVSGERTLQVSFHEGAVLSARPAETRPDGALAGFLLRTGVVSDTELARAREEQQDTLKPLAETLLTRGIAQASDIEQMHRLMTEETIFELFLWDDGSFAFRPEEVEAGPGDTPIGAEMVLLDALRMRDEWASVRSQLPDLSVRISQALDIENFRLRRASVEEASGMSAAALEKIFNLSNVRSSARRVIDLSRLGTFNGARGVVALMRHGVLQVDSRVEKQAVVAEIERAVSERPFLTWGLVGASAVLALALWFFPAPESHGHPIPRDTFSEARAAADLQHLRAEIEAYRWAKGAYPQALTALRGRDGRRLATVPLDQYSYARSGEAYRLRRVLP